MSTSELQAKIVALLDLRDRLEAKIKDYEEEYSRLTNINYIRTQEDNKRIKAIKKTKEKRDKDLEDLKAILKKIDEIDNNLSEANTRYATAGNDEKINIQQEAERIYQDLCGYVTKSHSDYEDLINSDLEVEVKTSKIEKVKNLLKKLNNKKLIGGLIAGASAIALIIAIKNGISNSKINKPNTNPDGSNPSSSNSDNNPSGSNQSNPDNETDKVVIPELEQEELSEIIKVEDESLISERAQDLLGYLNIKYPNHGITLEEITAYLNYKNGFVKDNTQEPTQKPVETPTTGTFTDINDEEQLYTRANELVSYFETLVPAQNMTVDQATEFLNYFYGIVDEPTYDGAAFTIDSINDLMFAELGSSPDILNEVKTSRGPAPIFVDYTKFFIDGSQGQKLAEQITKYRSAMIAGAGSDISGLRKEFTELFMKSWILKGNGGEVINSYALESAGERALIDLMFLNTAILCGESSEVVITHPITGDEVTLEWILNKANYEGCPSTLDDGTIITLDKSSSDLYAMYQQAVIRKQDSKVLELK